MATVPTIASRLQRRFIMMSGDLSLLAALRASLPQGWEIAKVYDLGELGSFADILQYRFMMLDLDEFTAFDPIDVIREVRGEMMLNIPIFCFGGDAMARDEARLNRADRFLEREEITEKMRLFCEQYGW